MIEKPTLKTPRKRNLGNPLHLLMRLLSRLMPAGKDGENEQAVQMMHRIAVVKDLLKAGPLRRFWQQRGGKPAWPVIPGSYVLGDPSAVVAVCTLTSADLMSPLARLPGVAIVGRVYTPKDL